MSKNLSSSLDTEIRLAVSLVDMTLPHVSDYTPACPATIKVRTERQSG